MFVCLFVLFVFTIATTELVVQVSKTDPYKYQSPKATIAVLKFLKTTTIGTDKNRNLKKKNNKQI